MKASSNEPGSRGFGFLSLKKYLVSHMEAHTCNSIIWEAKTGILLGVQVQPGLKSEGDPVLKHQFICLWGFFWCFFFLCVCLFCSYYEDFLSLSIRISCLAFLFSFGLVSWVKVSLYSLGFFKWCPCLSLWSARVWDVCHHTWVGGGFCLFINAHKKRICSDDLFSWILISWKFAAHNRYLELERTVGTRSEASTPGVPVQPLWV